MRIAERIGITALVRILQRIQTAVKNLVQWKFPGSTFW
eukprot:CAMPEP_0202506030 /NCGR_PEP_ID=MMETSP1361-20130828/49087_1 /ASSEMBLY_ACC=CAM_ASM_000849 /TAXON_ID=210615 /ORGANISM="Staurosira complex sp., Strain CCMP2646" /LENGTH=37 /DNA_ID= /DNA_START= /DNA_END= /DNA_ORIENTATION=